MAALMRTRAIRWDRLSPDDAFLYAVVEHERRRATRRVGHPIVDTIPFGGAGFEERNRTRRVGGPAGSAALIPGGYRVYAAGAE